tara:strand:+ start:3084 stop:4304 length:1221 start_codon:yes stop_codon:yes gene_type:complete
MIYFNFNFLLITLFLSFYFSSYTQTLDKEKLVMQKRILESEILKINNMLFSNQKKKKSTLEELEDLNIKINTIKKLINVSNNQVNNLEKSINANIEKIEILKNDINKLKDEYARLILKTYKSKSELNRLMFIFSSKNFIQAYKRSNYINQFAEYRKRQANQIKIKSKYIEDLNLDLNKQKISINKLIDENKSIKDIYEVDIKSQEKLIAILNRKENSYRKEIIKKQKKAALLENEIQRLIRIAINESNKKNRTNNLNEFSLTPEAKLISENFFSNKGNLPWPVEKGLLVQSFGKQRHPVVRTTIIKSNGITLATPQNETVRSIFDGYVMSILNFKGSNPTVLIQHGNYITSYSNLSKVYVKKGDKVSSKESVGEVFTNPLTGKSLLKFSIFKSSLPINPKDWIYKL